MTLDVESATQWFSKGGRSRGANRKLNSKNRHNYENESRRRTPYQSTPARRSITAQQPVDVRNTIIDRHSESGLPSNNTRDEDASGPAAVHHRINSLQHRRVSVSTVLMQNSTTRHIPASNGSSVQLPPLYERPEFMQQSQLMYGLENTEEDWSISIARNVTLKQFENNVVVKHPNIEAPKAHKIKGCTYFTDNGKSNHFALMLHPPGWVDRRNGKRRTALDVLMVRVIFSEIFSTMYYEKRSIQDVVNGMNNNNYCTQLVQTKPFSVHNKKIMAAIDSIYERQAGRDKMRSITEWLQVGR